MLEAADQLSAPRREHECGGVTEAEVHTRIAAEPFRIEIAAPDQQRVRVGTLGDGPASVLHLHQVPVLPLVAAEVHPRNLVADVLAEKSGVTK